MGSYMRPSTLHRFHHVTAGVRLELTWNRPSPSGTSPLRRVMRRLLFGGPDPFSPESTVSQAAFDRAMDLLNAGPVHLDEAEEAFRALGYSVTRVEEVDHHAIPA